MSQRSKLQDEWLTLSKAAKRLNVHPTSLRRWADNGEIPVLFTPGGHRRFSASDVAYFVKRHHNIRTVGDGIEQIWVNDALEQTRKEIAVHQQQKWLARFDDDSRAIGRIIGQRLIGLMLQYISDGEEAEHLLGEAQKIGHDYAHYALKLGLSLTEVLEASMFFHDTLVGTTHELPEKVRIRPEARRRLLRRINTFLNAVQLAVAEIYDARKKNSLSGA